MSLLSAITFTMKGANADYITDTFGFDPDDIAVLRSRGFVRVMRGKVYGTSAGAEWLDNHYAHGDQSP
ncbi:hypothetical protein [Mesorhizobium denitrificans]|nr:hypothetical protein [Mesorhizobium denitrificans]